MLDVLPDRLRMVEIAAAVSSVAELLTHCWDEAWNNNLGVGKPVAMADTVQTHISRERESEREREGNGNISLHYEVITMRPNGMTPNTVSAD